MSDDIEDKMYEFIHGKKMYGEPLFYHYTNINSFFHIVMNKNIWFSSLAFMNDTNEGINVIDSIRCSKENKDKLKSIYTPSISDALHRYFSFSATSLEDDISQWRAYTPLGQGICFGFENGFIKNKDANYIKCIYEEEEKAQVIMNAIPEDEFNDIFRTDNFSIVDAYKLNSSLLKLASQCKHQSFKPENESRWVIKAVNDVGLTEFGDYENVDFRVNDKLGLIPYIKCDIDISKIRKVIIGPQVPKENIQSLMRFMEKYRGLHGDITPCRFIESNVSLR
ncbi:DUF2971 domain-containing protein [Aliivibrio salmonicida]|uniref:DUF2971 domain-containing protein n=1 Tax=Aliivibrio salmonicida TaxID=40269 RepID=UPI00406C13CB